MTVILTMRDQMDPVYVQGNFDTFTNELNMQTVQGKQFIAVMGTDDLPLGLNVKNINTIRVQSIEDSFSGIG